MLERKLLTLVAALLIIPTLTFARNFRADDPVGVVLSTPDLIAGPGEIETSSNMEISFIEEDSVIAQRLASFARHNRDSMLMVSVFYGEDRMSAILRLRSIKDALVAAGVDVSNIMLMPIMDKERQDTASLGAITL